MTDKTWDEWIEQIAADYELNLGKQDKETEKQKRILEAAIHTFSEKGFNGASTQEIAKRAQVAEATIFKHYRSKKGLLLRLVIPVISKLATPYILRSVLKILEKDAPLDQLLQEVYKDRVHLVERNWKKVKIIVVESLFHPELREALQEHVAKTIYQVMSEKVEKWKAEGQVRNDLPTHVVIRSLLSIGVGYILARNIFPDVLVQEAEDKEIAWMTDVLLNGIGGPHERNRGDYP